MGKLCLERTTEFSVTIAPSGRVALDLLKSNGIQAIVSDYQMPEMDGLEFLKQVRAINKTIPFILFTGRGREEVAVKAFENGANFYLQKGGDPKSQFAELMHKIKSAVEHRRADEQVTTLNRLYTVISATNQAIVRIHDKKELLKEICRITADNGGFAMVWAGRASHEKNLIETVAVSGDGKGYPDRVSLSFETSPEGGGPIGTAFRKGTFIVCNDIERDPMMAPWRKGALERGYRSLAAVPFATDTSYAGVITFYASEPGFFNDQIIRLLDEQSEDISFALTMLDHEEHRISAEHDLKKSELKYRRLFQTAQDAILILDGDTGEIIDANEFILDMLGYPFEYFVGRHLWDLGFLKDKFFAQNAFAKLKSDGYIRYDNLPLETKLGEAIHVEFVSNVYRVEDKKIIQCNIRDITAWKRAEEALILANRKLNLLSGITRHDIKNQLTALYGYLEISRKTLDDPVRTSEYIAMEEKIAETIARQIDFTRDYEELGVKAPAWQNITAIIQKIIPRLPVQDIRVGTGEPDLEVFADPLLEKVFYNLIDNALRYGGERMTSISVASRENDGRLVVSVQDDGSGIRAEDKKQLFMKGAGKNTGLGLYLSREILSITGITISETGIPGKGAKFEIGVPEGAFRFTEKPAPPDNP